MMGYEMTMLDAAYIQEMGRRYDIRAKFYAAFKEVTQTDLSPKPAKGVDTVMLAERIIAKTEQPDPKMPDRDKTAQIAAIDPAKYIQATFAAAKEQNTGWFGKAKRAAANYQQQEKPAPDIAAALLARPETKTWIKLVQKELRYESGIH